MDNIIKITWSLEKWGRLIYDGIEAGKVIKIKNQEREFLEAMNEPAWLLYW